MVSRLERGLMKAGNRFEVILKTVESKMTNAEASHLLGLSVRQFQRLKLKALANGLKGLLFNRGHTPKNKVSLADQEAILNLRLVQYKNYNLLHFQDVLARQHDLKFSYEFIRRLLYKHNLQGQTKKRRPQKRHRQRFEMNSSGLLVQRDTSIHLWVPFLDKPLKLILDLDDHSRAIVGASFSYHDDVLSNMLVAWETIATQGLPVSYYMDNNAIYNPIRRLPKQYNFFRYRKVDDDTNQTLPQFKRALQELGIQCIHSTPYQPQGKGKVERIFHFLQDRLINEMITANVKSIDEANAYLKKFVNWYNHHHKHRVTNMIPQERLLLNNSFRPLPKNINLNGIFCLKYTRQVSNDNTIKFEGRTYQIKPNEFRLSYAKATVEIRITMRHRFMVYYKNQEIGDFEYKPRINKYLPLGGDILA